ncbi:diacylglycerol O-acyltransferase 1 [Agyrium rufum]|nr:diacylglycerol O-acyltransferase 1 [Agyrium rufum]
MSPALLNPEPAMPETRAEAHLPPKSYVSAVEENLPSRGLKLEIDGPSQYEGTGEDTAPRSPVRKPGHKKSGSLRINGLAKKDTALAPTSTEPDDGDLVVRRSRSRSGERLTTLRATRGYNEGVGQAEKEKKPKKPQPDLVSGRQAGAGWERSGIRWAPLNVPLKRRLQTLMVLWHTLSIAIFLTTFFFLCSIPLFWPIVLPYCIYLLFSTASYSGSLSRRSEFFRGLKIWSLFASYFPARLHRSEVLPSTRKYIFGYHPHGIISHGAFAAFGTNALGFSQLFPGITNTLLTLDSNFRIPIYREYALALGLASVSRQSCENLLSRGGPNGEGMGRAITIVIGGASEALDAQPGVLRLILKRRKGFVKLGIRMGADLVPVLAFGENELYEQLSGKRHPLIHKSQMLMKKAMGWTVPIFKGRGILNYDVGLMPYRRPVNVVVGRPIKVRRMEKPTEEYLNEIHAQYMQELSRLWDDWKEDFAGERRGELELVE